MNYNVPIKFLCVELTYKYREPSLDGRNECFKGPGMVKLES